MPEMTEEFLPVGKISGSFGVKGWVKIFSFTEPRTNILEYTPLFINTQGEWKEVEVSGGKAQGKGVIMGFKNVTDRNQTLPLIGAELAIKKSQLAPAEDDEYYWTDLIGLEVVDEQQQMLGLVDSLLETGANDVLVVKTVHGEEILIPFVLDVIVKSVDIDNKRILVDWQTDY